jgi:hypothetical protein
LRTGIPEYSCLCVSWEILSDATNETMNETVFNVLFKWMNLTENGVIRWVFIRLKSNQIQLIYFIFLTPLGIFEILLLPFGLRNAESTFQRMMTGFGWCGVVFCRLPALKGLSHEMDLAFEDIHHGRMNYTDSEPLMSLFL